MLAMAEEDEIEEDGVVEDEEGEKDAAETGEDEEEEGAGGEKKNVSPDADTFLLFTKPATNPGSVELPAGQIVEFLVGFANRGESEFVIETLDASFRYF